MRIGKWAASIPAVRDATRPSAERLRRRAAPPQLRRDFRRRELSCDGRMARDAYRPGSPSRADTKPDTRDPRYWFADLDRAPRETTEFRRPVRYRRTSTR